MCELWKRRKRTVNAFKSSEFQICIFITSVARNMFRFIRGALICEWKMWCVSSWVVFREIPYSEVSFDHISTSCKARTIIYYVLKIKKNLISKKLRHIEVRGSKKCDFDRVFNSVDFVVLDRFVLFQVFHFLFFTA